MNKLKASDVIDEIITTIELARVSKSQMVSDIQRMRFKIKPVSGDIAVFEEIRRFFVRPLWKMGKVDEIVQKYLHTLTEDEQDILFDFLEEFEYKTQVDFNHQLTKKNKESDLINNPLRLEVFRDDAQSSRLVN